MIDLGIKQTNRKTSSVIVVPDIDKVRKNVRMIPGYLVEDFQDYCMFCAKRFWVFSDYMSQEVCDPIKTDFMEAEYMTHAWRCQSCKEKNKRKCFDGRVITKPERWTGAISSLDRPKVWRDEISRVLVSSEKRKK